MSVDPLFGGEVMTETCLEEKDREEEKKELTALEKTGGLGGKGNMAVHKTTGIAPSTPFEAVTTVSTPERRLKGDDDLSIPQLNHGYVGRADKRDVDVTAETAHSEISEFSPTYSERRREEPPEPPPEEEDSSNDESSYFADPSNLPSPKSGRHFSQASIASAHSLTNRSARDCNRESDASLSLSDDSDDGAGMPAQPVSFPPQFHQRGVPELYPHPITRIHSVSSLVSTSSQNSTDNEELKDVAKVHGGGSGRPTPSGRRSPVPPSRVGPFFQSPTSNPSPPTILVSYPHPDYPHPQPHLMTLEELGHWTPVDGGGGSGGVPFENSVGRTAGYDTKESPLSSVPSKGSKESVFTYSEESEGGGYRHIISSQAHGDAQLQGQQTGSIARDASNSARDSSNSAPAGQTGSDEASAPLSGGSGHRRGLLNASDSKLSNSSQGNGAEPTNDDNIYRRPAFKVYWQRWIMLMYMSLLNLLSDWTCYSVAPIAILTEEAFGSVNAERLVVVFLGANAVATACEPIILSRLGLRRTVLFGALLLMIGSIIKSGGMPPIIQAKLDKGEGEWRVYLGFFLVGLSQPLYQCTPALLSASWFPERERTMATGVALNANQVGIGFAFIFGTLLVSTSDDIPGYFGLLSIISTLTFLGVLIQFDDAPPTPPSDTARVMRGTLDVGLPSMGTIFKSVRNMGSMHMGTSSTASRPLGDASEVSSSDKNVGRHSSVSSPESSGKDRSKTKARRTNRSSSRSNTSSHRPNAARRRTARPSSSSGTNEVEGFHGLAPAPSPARWGRVGAKKEAFPAPSPMMPGSVGRSSPPPDDNARSQVQREEDVSENSEHLQPHPFHAVHGPQYPYRPMVFPVGGDLPSGYPSDYGSTEGGGSYGYGYGGAPFHGYPPVFSQPVWDPNYQQYVYVAVPPMRYQQPNPYYSYQNPRPPAYQRQYESADAVLPSPAEPIDVGAEPVLTITPHHLDIDIRDDQILLSTRACLSRPGFIHALVAFTVSGIVINTLSTFMDYLVRLNGAGREYTGIVGGSFQFVIMISSLIVGQFTDKTRAYYSVTVGMLVLGAFGLAECGVNLDSDRGTELRFSLVIVAALVGPLQPVSTELGVDVVYPLSENTVLVIQQLFSNLLSALFIPCFNAFKDFGISTVGEGASEQPQYTFSFYMLIVIHAAATVFFATFNGRYVRYEHELEKKADIERREGLLDSTDPPYYGPPGVGFEGFYPTNLEQRPFIPPIV